MDGPTELSGGNSTSSQQDAEASSRQDVETQRSPARAQLALAMADLTRAAAQLAEAQEPALRLGAVIAEASRREVEIAMLRAADESRLGAWLAKGGTDLHPEPDPATILAEKRHEELAADTIAARSALPAAEQSFQRCAERMRELQRRRDAALCGAAIDAARDFAERYRAALTAALEHEAVLHGLRDELLARANRSDAEPGAMAAAARIGELIAHTKRAAAVRRNWEPACRLLAALTSDPDASI
jgi:hypothetical protein